MRTMIESISTEKDVMEKAVCLISGGIDSPVAVWLMAKKGITPICAYFDNSPFADETTQQRAREVVKKVRQLISQDIKMYIIPHGGNLADLLRQCPRNLTCVLCRRMMYRVAEKIALMEGAEAIVTGEIIGEHASQTLRNLHVETESLSEVTVLRPLAGMNKTEVESIARKIGTLDVSTQSASCCTGPPPQPRTRARFEEVGKAEKKLDIDRMIERSLRGAVVLSI